MSYKKLFSILFLVLFGLSIFVTSILGESYFTSKSGISFPVPDNWEWLGLTNDNRDFLEEKFRTDDGDIIMFGSSSIYDSLSIFESKQLTEEEIILYKFRITEDNYDLVLGDMSGIENLEFKTIGKETWVLCSYKGLLHIYMQSINGNAIIFMTNLDISSSNQRDLEDIISYVTEKEISKEEHNIKSISEEKLKADQDELNEGLAGGVFVILICSVVILLIPRVKYINCQACGEKNNSKNKYCKKCGNKLR